MPGLLGYCETKEEEDWHLEQERQAYEVARDAEEWEQMRKRVAKLEAALRPFGDAYRFTQSMGDFMRQQYLSSMTVTEKFTATDLQRAAELTE